MIRKEIKSLKKSFDTEDLAVRKEELLKDYFNYRLQKAGNQLKQLHLLKRSRREIAFINTLMNIKNVKKQARIK